MGQVSLGLAVILGIASAAVFAYFINKYYRIRKELKVKERIGRLTPHAQVFDDEELKQILLVYAEGDSPQFVTEMRNFRYRLEQECNCRVRHPRVSSALECYISACLSLDSRFMMCIRKKTNLPLRNLVHTSGLKNC